MPDQPNPHREPRSTEQTLSALGAMGLPLIDIERLSLVAAKIPLAVIMTDAVGCVEWVNPAFSRTTGYSAEEIIGRTPGRLLQGAATDPASVAYIRQQMTAKQPFDVQIVNYRKNGTRYWAHITAEPIFDEQGRFTRFIAVHSDISEKKTMDLKIAQQAALLDQAQDAIIVCDTERLVTFWSRSCTRLYGWTRAEAEGRPIDELIYRDTTRLLAARDIVARNGSWSGDMNQFTKAGEPVTIEARWNSLRDEAGKQVGIMAVNTDVTGRRRLEEQFERSQRHESVGKLASGIAHDFNNLLQPIFAGIGLLQVTNTNPEMERVLRDMESSSLRSAALVKQLVEFTKGETIERSAFDPRDAIDEIQTVAGSSFPPNISFNSYVADDVGHIFGDPTQIHQVLLNLCVNARDAMPTGGRIDVLVRTVSFTTREATALQLPRDGSYIELLVRDTGVGMTPELQERIFEPFFTTKGKGAGTGIGLATVASVVRGHGGAISVQSQVGAGTAFKIHLPTVVGVANATGSELDGPLPGGAGECILIVDDEEAVVASSRRILETHGYRVVVSSNGPDAIDFYQRHRADVSLVICDMAMPEMDGSRVLHELRQINPDLRAISASGLQNAGHDGVKHFLQKPYSLRALLTLVERALSDQV